MNELRELIISEFRKLSSSEAKLKAKTMSCWISEHIDSIVDESLIKESPLPIQSLIGKPLVPVLLTLPWDALYRVYPGVKLFEEPEKFTLLANIPEIWTDVGVPALKNLVDAWAELFKRAKQSIVIVNPYWSEQAINILVQRLKSVSLKNIQVLILTRFIVKNTKEYQALESFERFVAKAGGKVSRCMPEAYSEGRFTPLIHAKLLIIDTQAAYIGSANISQNGFINSFETGVLIEGESVKLLIQMVNDIMEQLMSGISSSKNGDLSS